MCFMAFKGFFRRICIVNYRLPLIEFRLFICIYVPALFSQVRNIGTKTEIKFFSEIDRAEL